MGSVKSGALEHQETVMPSRVFRKQARRFGLLPRMRKHHAALLIRTQAVALRGDIAF